MENYIVFPKTLTLKQGSAEIRVFPEKNLSGLSEFLSGF
jgi:hypothetical protein